MLAALDDLTAAADRPALLPANLLPDAMKPGFHCVRTHWIRGFMAFQLARRTRTVMHGAGVTWVRFSRTCHRLPPIS